MRDWIVGHAVQLVAGPLVGVLVYYAHEQLQRLVGWFKQQGPLTKRAASVALVAVLTPLMAALGISAPEGCVVPAGGQLDLVACLEGLAGTSWLTVAIGAVVAEGTHRLLHPKKPSSP